jgi:AraC-like DNA-binding protein
MRLYIKNMVCNRCKMVVKAELTNLGLNPICVQLGEVEIAEENLSEVKIKAINLALSKFGFERLTDQKKQIVEQIKTTIIELVHYPTVPIKINLSAYLSEKLNIAYPSLSATFSETEGYTIEHYFIQQKIEKVKELLTYGEKTLSEIAYILSYSSVAHLSAQFKKISGETPSDYKKSNNLDRKSLDEV